MSRTIELTRVIRGQVITFFATSFETFLKHLPQARILDAVDQAFGKVPPPSSDDDRTFKYFCGICWGVIKTNRGEAAQ